MDGADIVVLSFVAPILIDEWLVDEATFGVVFSAGLVGMTAGSLFLAPFADRFGRKIVLISSSAMVAVGMVLCALAENVTQLMVLRFVSGLGIGGILATAAILASEFAPKKYVAAAVMTVMAGYPTGAMLAGQIANVMIPAAGWQSLFIAAGLCSVVLILLMYRYCPESPGFLLARQKEGDLERANGFLSALGQAPISEYPERTTERVGAIPLLALFAPRHRTITLLCWVGYAGAMFVVYFLQSWIPKMATHTGYSLEMAINGSSIFNAGAIIGLFMVGWLTARWNLGRVIATLYASAALLMMLFSQMNEPVWVYYALLALIGLCQQSGNGAMYALITQLYPADLRTTGLGWAVGVGRSGGIVGPAAGGLALTSGMSISTMFIVFSLPMVVTAVCTFVLGVRHLGRR